MRYNPKFSLKNISPDEIKQISTDVLLGNKTGFLNNVDLSTDEGKQNYIDAVIAGKNPFKNPEESSDGDGNNNINTTTPWQEIIEQADGDNTAVAVSKNSKLPFENPLINAAYSKKRDEIQMETALPSDDISSRMLDEYINDTNAKKSMLSAVKFFQRMSSSLFTECDSCGGENTPAWTECQHCGFSSDGFSLKNGSKKATS